MFNDVVIGEMTVLNSSGLKVVTMNNFHDLPTDMTVLQMRGKSDYNVQVLAVEFDMIC